MLINFEKVKKDIKKYNGMVYFDSEDVLETINSIELIYEKQKEKIASLERQIKLMQNCDLQKVIEKQQKEIEELKQRISWAIKECEELLVMYTEYEKTVISKDKIREKIKDVSNGVYDAKLILEELLEE